jgi:hypothetical protein
MENKNVSLIRSTYEGKSEENKDRLPKLLATDVEWTEAEGFPYAGVYRGRDAILQNVFSRLATEWENYRAHAEEFIAHEDLVIVFGHYTGTYKKTGKSMRADFVHRYQLKDGLIIKMKQCVDSFLVQLAMKNER